MEESWGHSTLATRSTEAPHQDRGDTGVNTSQWNKNPEMIFGVLTLYQSWLMIRETMKASYGGLVGGGGQSGGDLPVQKPGYSRSSETDDERVEKELDIPEERSCKCES